MITKGWRSDPGVRTIEKAQSFFLSGADFITVAWLERSSCRRIKALVQIFLFMELLWKKGGRKF